MVDLNEFLAAIFVGVNPDEEVVCLTDMRPDPTSARMIFPARAWRPGPHWKWLWSPTELWPPAAYAEARIWNHSIPHPEGLGYDGVVCRLWQGGTDDRGYGNIKVEGFSCGVHRISYMCAHGYIPSSILVCHHCDRPSCIEQTHLFAGSQKNNLDDMRSKGRQRYVEGPAHHWAKLTATQVRAIRRSRKFQHEIAREYGLTQATVCRIRQGRTYRSVHG